MQFELKEVGGGCPMSSSVRCLSVLEKCKSMKQLKQTHAQVITCGLGTNSFALSRILAFCSDPIHGSLNHAWKLFQRIDLPTIIICNTMMKAFFLEGEFSKTLNVYTQMLRNGLDPDNYTFPYVLKACASLRSFYLGEAIHGHSLKLGLSFDVFVGNALIFMYSAFDDMELARYVFDEIPQQTSMAWTVMISGYAKQGNVDAAKLLFDEAPPPVKDVGLWGSMISGYVQNNCFKEGLHMFRLMQSAGLVPDEPIFVSILCASAHLGALDVGIWIHRHIDQLGLAMSSRLGAALTNMYAKCGSLDLAKRVFNGIPQRGAICWNAMISGMATHGDGEGALELFWKMEKAGVRPDDITFLAIFSACSYSGMAFEGLRVLNRMCAVYNIEPKSEHYGCIVGFLGRAGLFKEAKEIIRIIPDSSLSEEAIAWRALLSACCDHGQIYLAEVAVERLLQLENHSGVYVLLANLYAAAGKHDDARRIRKMMRKRGVDKMPGCSSIKINGFVHEFVAGEKTHPHMDEINRLLEKINNHLDYSVPSFLQAVV
ncbi:pentatricopeptide repeat-containing protein At2g20540-like [Malania oleifera]|uniref:pentatricopeptide repeat-containing protein At2g20540-like n=1 Tax=Malania oleifera TaxID=397392 RepID=UPI0025ADF135|nr:pentatricopeptide repeat-containing protein At2g20540-like [Malania oleifera]